MLLTRLKNKLWALTNGKERWSEAISQYLEIPEDEIIKAVGKNSGYTNAEKIAFSEKYDNGKRFIHLLNSEAEDNRKLTAGWAALKSTAIKQEWLNFNRYDTFAKALIPDTLKILQAEKTKEKLRIIDYGCGTSLFARLLIKKFKNCEILLCDVDGYSLNFAAHELSAKGFTPEVIKVDSDNFVPKISNQVNFIYCFATFEHIANPLDVVESLTKSLKNKGHILESFGGETGKIPDKDSSDSRAAWDARDDYFEYLLTNYQLKKGKLPPKNDEGHYKDEIGYRIWVKEYDWCRNLAPIPSPNYDV